MENVGNLKKPEIGENARVGTTDQTDLFRVRLVTSVEVGDGRRFAASLIKEMTGGERIRARRMKENFWEFEPTHKAIIVANHHPEVRGTDTGIWRRIKLVPFDVVIPAEERNPRLMEELEAEYEGILAWMVEGGLQWRHLGLSEPEPIEPIKTATQEYRDDMDVLANFILTRCVEGPGVSVYSTPLYNEYKQWAKASQSEARINSMIGLARAYAPINYEEFDANPWLLNCPNGTVDLRTGELRPHNPTDLLTKITHTKYNPHAKAPKFEAFLKRVLPSADLRVFVQRLTGYALTGDTSEQILPFFYGTGANGKSTFLNIILKAVGDYGLQAGQSLLLAKKNDSHPTELADLFRARFVVSSELEDGKRFAEALIKQLTGGDRIRARRMREDLWEFDPTHTVIVAANHKPEVRGTDEGIWRRIKIVPWEVMIPKAERDPNLPRKLEAELEGILAWAVQGAVEWGREGLGEPAAVTSQTDEYQKEMDLLGNFIDERCLVGPDYTTKADPLYFAFKEWAERNGEYKLPQKDFAGLLKERGFERKRKTSGYVWEGIGLRFDGDAPTDSTSMYPGGSQGTSPESGVGKPKNRDSEATMYPDVPKMGLNAQNPLANRELTPKTVHQGTSVHGSGLQESHEQLMEAIARVDTDEESK